MTENEIGTIVIDLAVALIRSLARGFLRRRTRVFSPARELQNRGFKVERQITVPITYKGIRFDEGYGLEE